MTRARLTLYALIAAAVLVGGVAEASTRYDPRLRFRTLNTPRFHIHYHQGEEAQAQRLARIAESVAARLDPVLGSPSGRVHVILVDQTDLSNGWATTLPYDVIEITAAAPGGESSLGNATDWLELVFAHEYTHIVHLSRSAGWIGGLRYVFGRHPLLYPNVYLPLWQIEGIATHQESQVTGHGRIPAGDFRMLVGAAAQARRFEPLDRASGGLVDWPSGQTPYAYGGYFHEHLARRYGEDSLRRLADATARHVPYLGSLAFRAVYGRSLGDLWDDFSIEFRADAATSGLSATRLTHHGFNVVGPRFGPDGRVYYSIENPHGFPSLMASAMDDWRPRAIATRYLGNRVGFAGSVVVFDQRERVRNVGLQSDLYAIDPARGSAWRLTRGARAADPDVSPDGQTIVFTVQRPDRRDLATLQVHSGHGSGSPVTFLSETGTHFASPRFSPDGRWIAAERLHRGSGLAQIVLIDRGTRQVHVLASSPNGRAVSPEWTRDGRRVLFASDQDGGAFQIFSRDVATGETSRLEGTGPSAQSPALSADGRTVVFVGYTPDGYDLFSMSLASARWSPVPRATFDEDEAPSPGPVPETSTAPTVVYSPWRSMAPRFWTPTIESDNDEVVIGAATASTDALGRHAYGAEVGWATSRARPDWQVAYAYDRWWPTLFVNVSDDTDPFRDGQIQTTEADAGALLPWRRVRWSQSGLVSLHWSEDRLECDGCGSDARVARNGLRFGWRLDAARAYGYSISDEEGLQAIATVELAREALGADGDGGAATIDLRAYVPLAPRHAVFAVRGAAGTGWGSARVAQLFSASGSGPQPGGFSFGSDAIGLLRGYGESDLLGRHAVSVNLDYRVPLLRIERGAGTLPIFARTLHGAVFFDAGQAWENGFRLDQFRTSIGLELSLDAVLGYVLPLTFTSGVAWRENIDATRGFAAFGRIGRAF